MLDGLVILSLLLVVLKLAGVIGCSWWFVALPLILAVGIFIGFVFVIHWVTKQIGV